MKSVIFLVMVFILSSLAGVAFYIVFHVLFQPSTKQLEFRPETKVAITQAGIVLQIVAPNQQPFPGGLTAKVWLETPAGILAATSITTQEDKQSYFFPYKRAGLVIYQVQIGQYRSFGRLKRQSLLPVNPLKLNVGARAVRLDTSRPPALVMHPTDALGNVSDAPILVTTRTPNGTIQQTTIRSQHLLAWTWLPVGQRPGLLHVAAQSSQAFGERAEVDILAGATQQAQLDSNANMVNDPTRDQVELLFNKAIDQFGNPATDGAAVEFTSQSALGWNLFLTRPLVRSSATGKIPLLGSGKLQARAEAYQSPKQSIKVKSLPWKVWLENNQLLSSVFRDELGSTLDDGTPIELDLINKTTQRHFTTYLKNGRIGFPLPDIGAFKQLEVTVFGETKTIQLNDLGKKGKP